MFSKLKIKRNISKDFLFIVGLFLIWRLVLSLVTVFSINNISLSSNNFLGGGFFNYNLNPFFYSQANFDGEHYLSIANFGYKGYQQVFFPVYPKLISVFSIPITQQYPGLLIGSLFVGLVISNLAFLIALILLWELIKLDYSKKIAYLTIILLICFPTSFYFGIVYTESLFLLLTIASFYFLRLNNFFLSGLVGMIASGARLFGVILFPSLIIELWSEKKLKKNFLYLCLIPLGLLSYMFYLWKTTGNPIQFFTLQKLVGEQRISEFTWLPQVYFRYIKILLTMDATNPLYKTIILEFWVGILFFMLPIVGYFKRVRYSYLFYAFFSFIITTVQGSLSSVPRYVLVIFPSFLILALIIDKFPKIFKVLLICLLVVYLFFEAALFFRGYWVA